MTLRALSSVAALALSAGTASADFSVHVLHINDFHSRIEQINRFGSTCGGKDVEENKCFGGVARLSTKINEVRDSLRAQGKHVIVLDAGDQFQGSLFYTMYKGAAEAEFMGKIGFDAMAIGNHEFDDGPEGLAAFLDRVDFPVVTGNVDMSASNLLAGRVPKYAVLTVGDEKIGIVSAVAANTPETSSPGASLEFGNEIESLRADVADLTAQGVTKIIALTHVGFPEDLRIAEAVEGIDAVIGGHTHTYLSASDPARKGAYPTWVSQPGGAGVPVVQAGAYGQYLGHLELQFDDAGNLLYAGGDTIVLDASVAQDPDIEARVRELAGPLEELKARVVAEATAPIDGDRTTCRQVECTMGNLVAEAMLDRVKDQGITIAFQNGGGLRASIDAGPVAMGQVLAVLPFQNSLSTFQTTGATLLAALENGVGQVEEGAGRFPQVAGMTFAFDPALPAGARVSDVMVRSGDAWVAIDPAAVYGVVTNDFVRKGGDGFRMFATNALNAYDYGPDLADVLADYMAKSGPYTPALDGRITRK